MCAQFCMTFCNTMDCSLPSSSVHKILQESWSGVPFPPPGDIPEPGIKATSTVSLALTGRFFTTELLGKPNTCNGSGISGSSSNNDQL